MAFIEDLDEFLDTEDGFAVVCNLIFSTGFKKLGVLAIYDPPFESSDLSERTWETRKISIHCKEIDVEELERGDKVEVIGEPPNITGGIFDVLSVEPDGTGMATVVLAEQANTRM